MGLTVFYGIMIPFLGTSLGAAMVFFLKKQLSGTLQEMAQLSLLGAVILPPCLQELPD